MTTWNRDVAARRLRYHLGPPSRHRTELMVRWICEVRRFTYAQMLTAVTSLSEARRGTLTLEEGVQRIRDCVAWGLLIEPTPERFQLIPETFGYTSYPRTQLDRLREGEIGGYKF